MYHSIAVNTTAPATDALLPLSLGAYRNSITTRSFNPQSPLPDSNTSSTLKGRSSAVHSMFHDLPYAKFF